MVAQIGAQPVHDLPSGTPPPPPRIVVSRGPDGEFDAIRPELGLGALVDRVSRQSMQRLIVGLDIPIRSDQINQYGRDGSELYR